MSTATCAFGKRLLISVGLRSITISVRMFQPPVTAPSGRSTGSIVTRKSVVVRLPPACLMAFSMSAERKSDRRRMTAAFLLEKLIASMPALFM